MALCQFVTLDSLTLFCDSKRTLIIIALFYARNLVHSLKYLKANAKSERKASDRTPISRGSNSWVMVSKLRPTLSSAARKKNKVDKAKIVMLPLNMLPLYVVLVLRL